MKLMDNLDAQTNPAFKAAINYLGTRDFFYPGGEKDEHDSRVWGRRETRMRKQLQLWLDIEGNLARWEGEDEPLTASDRRILMTKWVAGANDIVDRKYFSLWRYFEKRDA